MLMSALKSKPLLGGLVALGVLVGMPVLVGLIT
jgi:hypothetical protein